MSFDFVENFTLELPDFSKADIDFFESFNSKHGLIIEVAAIHEGLTSNYNNYSAEELEKALQSWVEPYPKPIILNHDLSTEPIGRVMAARMDKEADGSSFVRLQVAITDPVAAQKVLDKRYLTGSVGGRAGKALCSISGEDLASEDASGRPRMPKYRRGKVYKGKLAYIDMKDISFKEYSFVNQPADQKSGVRSTTVAGGDAPVAASDDWVAKSSAFVLNMDNEDIISIEENRSILSSLKKKESKPIYLHLKGAFLTALALQESESYINNTESLLSNEDSNNINSEETHNMDNVETGEDILAVAEGLSEDLSNIAASASDEVESKTDSETEVSATEEVSEESEEATKEEAEVKPEEVSEESDAQEENSDDTEEKISTDDSEEADVQAVDSENAEKPEESSSENGDGNQETVEQSEDLSDNTEGTEQELEDLKSTIKSLEEENAKLKSALHRTLVERVVDTKIAFGYESADDRESLISEHTNRTAASLADTLRDLAKTPAKAGKRLTSFIGMPEVTSEAEVATEENVVTVDKDEVSEQVSPVDSFEQVLVDALMGRRKL
jgi:regulator of replication initiation timing